MYETNEAAVDEQEVFEAIKILKLAAKRKPDFIIAEFLKYSETEMEKLSSLLEELKSANASKDTYQKGKKLEEVIRFVLEETGIYLVRERVLNNSTEIDLFLKMNDLGKVLGDSEVLNYIPAILMTNKIIICECKNYSGKIESTFVRKFCSIMQERDLKLGLFFSFDGLKGRGPWDSAVGLVKKLYLKHELIVLDFNFSDLEAIKEGRNIFMLIEEKFQSLVFQTSLDFDNDE